MRVRFVGVVALMALVLASCGGGTTEAAGPSEGIQVHGDWTIDIYNEDGSLDDHLEFSNALTVVGGRHLAQVLARVWTPTEWRVSLISNAGEGICLAQDGQPSLSCAINEGIDPSPERPDTTGGLVVSTYNANGDDTGLRLEGSFTAQRDGTISRVTSLQNIEEPAAIGAFTSTSIVPESVSAGQSVQVRVDISFTSG